MIRWFKFNRCPYGTVYLMQPNSQNGLFKVGFTTRRTKDRRTELNRVAGDNLKIVGTVSMPWARDCENKVLRNLRRNPFRKRDHRGTEWFWLRKGETIDDVMKRIEKSAARVKLTAQLKLSWPKDTQIKVYRSGKPKRNFDHNHKNL